MARRIRCEASRACRGPCEEVLEIRQASGQELERSGQPHAPLNRDGYAAHGEDLLAA